MSSFVDDMALSDIQLSEGEIMSEADRLMKEFGFPYKNKYGDTFYFLGIPHTSGASEAVVRVDGNGRPYSTFGPASTDTDVTVIPGSVYLVKVYGKSGAVEVLDDVFFSHEDNARVAEILLDEDALPEDSDYYEEAYMEKYGEYPDSDVAYSYAEFEGDASRKYGVSDSVGSDFEADFLEGAARELSRSFGSPLHNKYGDDGYFVAAPAYDGASRGAIILGRDGKPHFEAIVSGNADSGDTIVDTGSVYLVSVNSASEDVDVLREVVYGHEGRINEDFVASCLFREGFLPKSHPYYDRLRESYRSLDDEDLVSDSVGQDFTNDFLDGAARDLRKESDEELLASLESDHSPENLSRVAWILHKQGRTSLKDGRREVLAIANGPDYDKPLDYSYNQRAWTHVVDCDGVTRMSDIDSSVPGRYPANRRSSGRRK